MKIVRALITILIVGLLAGAGGGSIQAQGSRFAAIDAPQARGTTFAYGINQRGDIVGYYRDSNGERHGYVWH